MSDVTQHYINSFHFTNIYLQRRSDGDDFSSMFSDNIIHDAILCVVLRKAREILLQTFCKASVLVELFDSHIDSNTIE